ncbi:MAG: hypothetical protein IPL49_15320 [Saprospirales bacterium]|nr:hypothetical protein [Saprospirales bacterium]
MITINCSNPICGKSFLYDETKFPGAKKVQCPHCKTIQELNAGEEEVAETPFFEEPKEQEPAPSRPEPVATFTAPAQKQRIFIPKWNTNRHQRRRWQKNLKSQRNGYSLYRLWWLWWRFWRISCGRRKRLNL